MFFIFGIKTKLIGKEDRKIIKNGFYVNAIIKIYKYYFELFFIPLIPFGRKYSIYIPNTDEYFETNYFSKGMPEEYLEICKEVGRKY